MVEITAPDDQKRRVRASFNTIAATYDHLRFLQPCAGGLLELAALPRGARVLDVATGTGLVAMVAGQVVGPRGRVVGVDLSPEMLARAQEKLARAGLTHVEFLEGDAERLDFPDESFDVVLCASSLFLVPDMLAALREWRRVLTPGGCAGFSSFGPTFLQPLRDLWTARSRRHGMTAGWPPTHRLPDPATCQELLREAGFSQIDVRSEQLGYYLHSGEERWEEIRAGLEGMPLLQLTPAQRAQVKAEHVAELDALATAQGIWVDVPAIFAFGWKRAALRERWRAAGDRQNLEPRIAAVSGRRHLENGRRWASRSGSRWRTARPTPTT